MINTMNFHRDKQISIPKFYENKNVFITGATGFIGRLLVEKLLRVCPGISKVYVLVRAKRGKSVQDRLKDIIDIPLFDKLREQNKTALDKIVLVEGNTEELGFDISTAYCNCDHSVIEEKLYPSKIDWRDLINLAENCDENTLEVLTQKFIHPLPNTYTFTKSVGEHAVEDIAKDKKIPTVIARPTIVVTAYSDPLPGWIDNFNGPGAFIYGIGRGVVRGTYVDLNNPLDFVFADNVIKALIVASWEKGLAGPTDEVNVLNIATDVTISMYEQLDYGLDYLWKNPSPTYLWPAYHYAFTNTFLYFCFTLLYHVLPAMLVDLLLLLSRKKPMYFMFNNWLFKNEKYVGLNRKLLDEDVEDFHINYFGLNATKQEKSSFLAIFFRGIRKYLAKEGCATEANMKKQNRYFLAEKVWITFWAVVAWYLVFIKFDIIMVLYQGTYSHLAKE